MSYIMSASAGLEIGTVQAFPMALPSKFLECNGAAISRVSYSKLFDAIGVFYGAGDGSTTFNIPDYRGQFLRGLANGSGNDPDRASRANRGDGVTGDNVGTKQTNQYQSHNHTASAATSYIGQNGRFAAAKGSQSSLPATSSSGGNETRPRNINVIYGIKF